MDPGAYASGGGDRHRVFWKVGVLKMEERDDGGTGIGGVRLKTGGALERDVADALAPGAHDAGQLVLALAVEQEARVAERRQGAVERAATDCACEVLHQELQLRVEHCRPDRRREVGRCERAGNVADAVVVLDRTAPRRSPDDLDVAEDVESPEVVRNDSERFPPLVGKLSGASRIALFQLVKDSDTQRMGQGLDEPAVHPGRITSQRCRPAALNGVASRGCAGDNDGWLQTS